MLFFPTNGSLTARLNGDARDRPVTMVDLYVESTRLTVQPVCVCVSQTLFQREVNLRLENVHDVHAGGMAVLLLAMPTKLWSLDRKRMWTHILVPALLKLLTRCYTSVFPSIRKKESLSHLPFPLHWISFHPEVFLFNCFKIGVSQGFFNFGSVPQVTLDRV